MAFFIKKNPAKTDSSKKPDKKTDAKVSLEQAANDDVEHIFNDQFREELRNRGRLHFEKIIGENAMFLQQDLQLTTSQLNDFMKTEITSKLQDEFSKYEQSIDDAKKMAVESITKTKQAIDEQRENLKAQLEQQVSGQQQQMLKNFSEQMADVINHYILQAIGQEIDLSDQLEYIMAELEANKQAILADVNRGT